MAGRDPCQALRELLATMHALRTPGGCPWDAEQTPASLAPYILEEACETIEAIETGSPERLADELGDLLLQIVFQAEIAAERGQFDFADVATGINAKLVRRHPHVFGDSGIARTRDDLARQWERIKRAERPKAAEPATLLGPLPGSLPALQCAQKLIGRARRAGVNLDRWLSPPPTGEPLDAERLGKTLLALVTEAERNGLDAEQALRRTIRKILVETGPEPVSINNNI